MPSISAISPCLGSRSDLTVKESPANRVAISPCLGSRSDLRVKESPADGHPKRRRPQRRHFGRSALAVVSLLALAACSSSDKSGLLAAQDATLGDAALNAGNPDAALRLADETLARDPANAAALTRRGVAFTALGRLAEARDSLRQAVARQPRNVTALLALGRVQLPVDPIAAEASFQAVLHQDAGNAAALNNLGIARNLQGRHADAEEAFRAALAAAPDMTAAQVNLALCLAIRGQGEQAIGLLRPLADHPDATRKVREDYAAVLAMSGQRPEAERILGANMDAAEVAPALDLLALARTPQDRVAH
jgi:Flp pilus assembly protein TadD